MRILCDYILSLLLTCAAALFASLPFPGVLSEAGFTFLTFISLIPVFCLVRRASWPKVFLEGLVYGFVFYLCYNYWLKTFHPLAILIAPILESVQYLILFPLLKLMAVLFRKRGYIAQTILYTAYLYVTQMGFLGYPYGNISAALYQFTPFIQLASITGIWGLCLLVVLPQTLVAEMLEHRQLQGYRLDILIIAILYVLNLCYGFAALHYYDVKEPERELRIASVQHSADSWQGGYATYRRNFETLRDLSLEAMAEEPDMVAWSETAFVPSVAWHDKYPFSYVASSLTDEFVEFGKSLPVPLVTGNPEGIIKDETLPAYLKDGSWNWKTYNTVILFGEGEILGTYRKQRLVPFTEHFPYEKQLPWLYELLLANDYKWWEEGEEATVFEYDGVRFSTPICFEDTFGYLSAEFVENGADLLLNMTNDSWSGSVPAEVQHMQLAAFRAVENRRPLLRSTNSGITCLVLPSGRIVDPLEPFTEAWHVYTVPIGQKEGLTFYTRHPDLLAKLCLTAVPLLLISGIYVSIRRREAEKLSALYERYGHLFDELDDFYWD